MPDPTVLTQGLRDEAARIGFVACGIAAAQPDLEARRHLEARIRSGSYQGMPWFTLERAQRSTDPASVFQRVRSIVSLAAPYARRPFPKPDDGALRGKVARYAWGRDYHRVLEKKLKQLSIWLAGAAPGTESRALVDYGPLAERAYAARAGTGWFGKNTNLLLPGTGSMVLLAELLTSAILEPDIALKKTCGACRRCLDACPTGALTDAYTLDNERCISYQTIENRGPIPRELRPLIGDWLFGCDICQEVCPVGGHSSATPLPEFDTLSLEGALPALLPLLSLDEAAFRERFAGRAIMRAKRDGLIRNACVVLGNIGDRQAVPALSKALSDASGLVRGHAAWALGRLGGSQGRAALRARQSVEEDLWVREEIILALLDSRAEPPLAAAPV